MDDSIKLPFRGSVEAGKQLQELSEKLRTVGHDGLLLKLRRNIRAAGRPVVTELQGKVRGVHVMPSGKTPSPSHLRDRVAGALTTSVTAKRVRIMVNPAKVGPYGSVLPKYLDATGHYKRWRHPVYGHRDRWSEQSGQPWFFKTITQHSGSFRNAVLAAMDETARELEK